jgi:hypothetical protein
MRPLQPLVRLPRSHTDPNWLWPLEHSRNHMRLGIASASGPAEGLCPFVSPVAAQKIFKFTGKTVNL